MAGILLYSHWLFSVFCVPVNTSANILYIANAYNKHKWENPTQDLFPMQFVRLFQMNSRQISDCNCASSLRRKKWAASDVVGEVSQTETAQRLSRFGIASYLHAWNKVIITKTYKGLLSNMSQCKFCKTSKVAYIWQNKVVKFYLKKKPLQSPI